MNEYSTLCTVKDGKLKLFDRQSFDQALARFGDGEELDLIVREISRKRSDKQNRFFHGPILKAFKRLGYYQQEAKDMLCLRFIPREIKQLDGVVVVVPGHTADLTVEEFNDLIDQCIQLAAENDVHIEDSAQWRQNRSAA